MYSCTPDSTQTVGKLCFNHVFLLTCWVVIMHKYCQNTDRMQTVGRYVPIPSSWLGGDGVESVASRRWYTVYRGHATLGTRTLLQTGVTCGMAATQHHYWRNLTFVYICI